MEILLKLIESLKERVYPYYVLLLSIMAGISVFVFYGSSYILKELYDRHMTLNQQLSLASILFLIFAWLSVTLIETDYFEKLKINEIIVLHKNTSILFVNILNSILLSLMLINSILKPFFFIILYGFYTITSIIFIMIFDSLAKKVVENVIKMKIIGVKNKNLIKFYYFGIYKKILIAIQFSSVILSFILYYKNYNLFAIPVVIFIIFNEIVYWGIRIYIYKRISTYELNNKEHNKSLERNI